ncbi:MAG TPA: protein-tyrosine phosphatase family protein [Ignavibacteria bacterium]|jgi:protein-tyrosine phosphatase
MIRTYIITLTLLLAVNILPQDKEYLIFDEPCNDSLPVHFRKSSDGFHIGSDSTPDTTGMKTLHASGSAEFCTASLIAMVENIAWNKITVVDLRQESHGFVNDLCVSWYGKYDWGNVGLSREEVETDEKNRLDSLLRIKDISVTLINKKDKATNEITESSQIPLVVKSVHTEKELVQQFKIGYFRITATDHRKPENEDVDRFIEFVKSLESNTWLHFHCHAGDGRTTTFLCMYDMIRNSNKVSLIDILQRQYLIGGINLAKDDDYPEFDKKYALQRTEFLSDFYNYCRANSDNFKTLFSEWIASKKD